MRTAVDWAKSLAMNDSDFRPVRPWPLPQRRECDFYTCMDIKDGETVENVHWDIRGRFESYVGGFDFTNKSVLDVGTASGFLAFSAEAAGASAVTALDALNADEFNRVPFKDNAYIGDRRTWIAGTNGYLNALKKSFWYTWHKRRSKVEVVYAPASQLWRWNRRFDVVIAGAIVEHMSDPIAFLTCLAGLATDTVIIAFTPVLLSDEAFMQPMNTWSDPAFDYSWWELSLGLYNRIFSNLGFSVSLSTASAICHEYDPPRLIERPTLIAKRMRPGEAITTESAPVADADPDEKDALKARILELESSTSWRITRPLRNLAGLISLKKTG